MSEQVKFEFRTKAETLESLQPLIKTARVPDLVHFSLEDWQKDKATRIKQTSDYFDGRIVVVRSSAMSEDAGDSSLAGQFESVLSVPSNDHSKLREAIETVITSLPGDRRDRVLVQEMTLNMQASGVIMTFDVSRGAPYYCIEFDDESGRTDVVTSGSGAHKSLYVFRGAPSDFVKSHRIRSFLALAKELEELTGSSAIDIEFGLNAEDQLYLYQVRRIVLARNWHPVTERRVERELRHLERFLEDRSQPRERLLGDRTILAVMPDWNPAEIIGTTPRPLAASLYRLLVTDAVWSRARKAMGYRDLGDTDLMVLMGQQPYVDVRSSFNSFLPDGINDSIGATLVNAWLDRLEANPEYHDKVEFEIVPTCVDFTFLTDFEQRYGGLLSTSARADFVERLTGLTRANLTQGPQNTLKSSLDTVRRMSVLAQRHVDMPSPYASLNRARWLLQTCRSMGTFSFAIAARHGFIAEALLRSAVRREALTVTRLNAFKRTIRTISGTMLGDYAAVSEGKIAKCEFLAKYGHLRPGTYEITSLRYDERGDDLFQDAIKFSGLVDQDPFRLTDTESTAIAALLKEANLDVLTPAELLAYASDAIAARENVKFAFSKLLSDALSAILRWGYPQGLSRQDLSYLTWTDIAETISVPMLDDIDRHFLDLAHHRRRESRTAQSLKFAHIISRPRDIYVATLNRSVPNFIGLGAARGKVQKLTANTSSTVSLEGRIVCIENADPGFDWIFTKGIKALVTRFGGANSHMSVRCAELGIPAAIGCGDQIFERIANAPSAELNCSERYLRATHV